MIARFEELDWQETPIGELTLRRRTEPAVGEEIYEVRLGDEYLMSSLFTVAEEELADLGLAAVDGDNLSVLVGGRLVCTGAPDEVRAHPEVRRAYLGEGA